MKAVVIIKPGGPDVLNIQERPKPHPGSDEVLIKVFAAGINRPDVFQRKGNYPPPPGASPDIPGLEVAGVVEAIGDKVAKWKVGDKICALLTGGGYAEYCTAPEGQCLEIPSSLTFAEAASLPETFFTVWNNVFDRGQLKPTETLLIHGGSSGIGVTGIQLAKAWGAKVVVTAGSEEKCIFCEKLGADKAINYKKQNFAEEIKQHFGGADVVLDMIGGDYTAHNLDILNEDGRLVLINAMKGDQATIRLSQIMRKRLIVTGSLLRVRSAAFKATVANQLRKHVWPWLISGQVKPIVFKTFSFENARDAHELMERGTHMGKLVLIVQNTENNF
jgi:NADPH2:quinone reductase